MGVDFLVRGASQGKTREKEIGGARVQLRVQLLAIKKSHLGANPPVVPRLSQSK